MCYRELQCIEYACQHKEPYTESKVDCGSTQCRYSAQHVKPCAGCSTTCLQTMGRASPKVGQRRDTKCPHCAREQAART